MPCRAGSCVAAKAPSAFDDDGSHSLTCGVACHQQTPVICDELVKPIVVAAQDGVRTIFQPGSEGFSLVLAFEAFGRRQRHTRNPGQQFARETAVGCGAKFAEDFLGSTGVQAGGGKVPGCGDE